jgi:hypothetical protein
MSSAKRLHYDYADYLRSLEMGALKLEYCDGVIYAMAGGTPAHAQLGAAIIAALHRTLPKSCRVATSDLKVRVEATDLSTFPDVSVVCGPAATSTIDNVSGAITTVTADNRTRLGNAYPYARLSKLTTVQTRTEADRSRAIYRTQSTAITYRTVNPTPSSLFVFAAVVGPELLCPDRRNGVLNLYRVRPLTGTDFGSAFCRS